MKYRAVANGIVMESGSALKILNCVCNMLKVVSEPLSIRVEYQSEINGEPVWKLENTFVAGVNVK